MKLDGAVVVVTGASRGIGRATCALLSERGARVVAVAREQAALERVIAGTPGSLLAADLTDPAAAEAIVGHALERHGGLDAVVTSAGVGYVGATARASGQRLAELVDLNLRAPVLLAAAAAPHVSARRGALVFVSSIAGLVGVPDETVYSATKAGLEAFARLLREELSPSGVSVSTVAPGVVATDFLRAREVPYRRRVPRPLPPEVVAEAIVRALVTGRPRVIVPRWLGLPATLARVAPGLYRRGARRFG